MERITNTDTMPRCIALVDCNNFYASCERVFNPSWNNRPIGVLSNNDGCIIARSNELKDAGIKMGEPYFKCKQQLKDMGAIVVSSNYALYGDMSGRVMRTLSRFTPDIEIYSIDEAWLDVSGYDRATLDAYARKIVTTTHRNTGIPVSLGIGSTKVLAKVANRICKKQKIAGGVFNINGVDNLQDVLSNFDVGDIWGVGHRWAEKLKAQGIHTAWQLRQADDKAIRQQYNVVMQRIILELRGIHCLDFEDIEPKKQIIASRSFGGRVTEINSLLEAVSLHATRVGEKLRLQHSVCGRLQVSIRTGRHNPRDNYMARSVIIKFPVATADTRKLISAAREGVERVFEKGYRYAKAGVMAFDIMPMDSVQQSFFGECDDEKAIGLMKTIDLLNAKYGRHTMKFASEGIKKPWSMKRGLKSGNFTTSWQELLIAH